MRYNVWPIRLCKSTIWTVEGQMWVICWLRFWLCVYSGKMNFQCILRGKGAQTAII